MNREIIIRSAVLEDAEDILRIYTPYVEDTDITFEFQVPTIEEFRERMVHTLEKYPYFVALDEMGQILGYTYASPFKGRPAYNWSVETSIYVDRNYKGRGIGSKLYEALEHALKLQHIVNACACICASYDESILFHHKCGYRLVATFHKSGYKSGRWHDMVWMEKFLGEHQIPPKDFVPYPELC